MGIMFYLYWKFWCTRLCPGCLKPIKTKCQPSTVVTVSLTNRFSSIWGKNRKESHTRRLSTMFNHTPFLKEVLNVNYYRENQFLGFPAFYSSENYSQWMRSVLSDTIAMSIKMSESVFNFKMVRFVFIFKFYSLINSSSSKLLAQLRIRQVMNISKTSIPEISLRRAYCK